MERLAVVLSFWCFMLANACDFIARGRGAMAAPVTFFYINFIFQVAGGFRVMMGLDLGECPRYITPLWQICL